MTNTRWITALALALSAVTATAQTVSDGAGVKVDLGTAAVLHRTGVPYPSGPMRSKVGGSVVVETMLDATGNVIDARVLSGPNELRRTVLQSVLQWHFVSDGSGG